MYSSFPRKSSAIVERARRPRLFVGVFSWDFRSEVLHDSLVEEVCALRCWGAGGTLTRLGTRGRLRRPCAPTLAPMCVVLHGRAMAAAAILELWPSIEKGMTKGKDESEQKGHGSKIGNDAPANHSVAKLKYVK